MIRANLLTSFGSFRCKSVRVKESIKGPVDWSANLIDPLPGFMAISESQEFRIEIKDGSDYYITPPLVCSSINRQISVSGHFGTLAGIDKSHWLASKDDLSLPTFINSSSIAVVGQCFQSVGLSVADLISMPVPEDDVKNSKILDVLTRYLEFTGQEYIVDRDGVFRCLPVSYLGSICPLIYYQLADSISHGSRIDSMKFEKTSKLSGDGEVCFKFDSPGFKTVQLPRPLYRCQPVDRSAYGYISHVTTFNGGTNGVITGFFSMQSAIPSNVGQINMALPTTHVTLVVNQPLTLIGTASIDAKCCFVGNPADPTPPNQPIQVSPAFRRQIAVAGSTRPARNIWTDTLMPSPEWVNQYRLEYLQAKNKSYHPMSASCPLSLFVSLGQSFTYPGMPVGKIESFEHTVDVSSSSASTQVDGYVPWPVSVESISITSF